MSWRFVFPIKLAILYLQEGMGWYLLLLRGIYSSEMELLSVDGEGKLSFVVMYHDKSRGGWFLGVKGVTERKTGGR